MKGQWRDRYKEIQVWLADQMFLLEGIVSQSIVGEPYICVAEFDPFLVPQLFMLAQIWVY